MVPGHGSQMAQGTWNTRPVEILIDFLSSGSEQSGDSSTPSAPRLEAFLNRAPMLSTCTPPRPRESSPACVPAATPPVRAPRTCRRLPRASTSVKP